jgi:hypothetical protein
MLSYIDVAINQVSDLAPVIDLAELKAEVTDKVTDLQKTSPDDADLQDKIDELDNYLKNIDDSTINIIKKYSPDFDKNNVKEPETIESAEVVEDPEDANNAGEPSDDNEEVEEVNAAEDDFNNEEPVKTKAEDESVDDESVEDESVEDENSDIDEEPIDDEPAEEENSEVEDEPVEDNSEDDESVEDESADEEQVEEEDNNSTINEINNLVDELANLVDVPGSNAEEFTNTLNNIKTKGKTIILVTHDENIASYADRIVRIENGKIV